MVESYVIKDFFSSCRYKQRLDLAPWLLRSQPNLYVRLASQLDIMLTINVLQHTDLI